MVFVQNTSHSFFILKASFSIKYSTSLKVSLFIFCSLGNHASFNRCSHLSKYLNLTEEANSCPEGVNMKFMMKNPKCILKTVLRMFSNFSDICHPNRLVIYFDVLYYPFILSCSSEKCKNNNKYK